MTVHRTIELDEAQDARLEEIAKYHGVDVAQLVTEAAERLLEEDAAVLAAIEEGRASVARGEVFENEEVFAALYARTGSHAAE